MLWRALRRYLDPFAHFKSLALEDDALEYNRRHRGILLVYIKRWTIIGLTCAGVMEPLVVMARVEPMFCLPILGLELGFSAAFCMLLVSVAVYVVLGLRD